MPHLIVILHEAKSSLCTMYTTLYTLQLKVYRTVLYIVQLYYIQSPEA